MKKTKRKWKKWTKKDEEKLVRLFADGVKRADIARSMKRSVGTIDQRLHKMRKLGLHQDKIGTLQERRKRLPRQQTQNNTKLKREYLNVKKQFNPVNDFESVTKMFAQRHKEIEAKCGEQRLVIEDTIEKLEVLLGRLRKVIE